MIARIEIGAGGAARGVIHWQGLGHEHRLCGDEVVEGFLSERSLDIEGLEIGPGLARDHYRVTLAPGKLSGSFTGASRAFGDWSGRMTGTYRFEEEK
ncbi:MAG: hypothetical protein IT366_17875 [Candidatus Hydrogenedentes bacterium]|nr:hypothetical protein [Candidatus Hydrogenedentota bacterium]